MLMTRPHPRFTMPSITCFVTLKRLVWLVSITAFQFSSVIFRKTPSRVMPALFTSTSTSPTSFFTFANAPSVDSQSPTLPSDAMKEYPSSAWSASHVSRRGEFGPQPTTTVKPSLCRRWEIAVPMPPMPPVTYAIRLLILIPLLLIVLPARDSQNVLTQTGLSVLVTTTLLASPQKRQKSPISLARASAAK